MASDIKTTGIPQKFDGADNCVQINAVFLKIDKKTGKTIEIKRIRRKY